ncbi:hypothetical protein F4560_007404 [Saccharothrix ecbatanensis]|uniref:Secreted protein n=1 Tax=Saccharothrix ecbatanensis TaxID=1105145 RepID=A0A7W9HT18_9PSEU|nr:hypothetical protein [Saccharothrix ecbatanensis]MBB5807636.1 hypothetical protein [Saccharothrix ecbatanensis]
MLKKAGAVAIAAAGLMMLGSPAFATPHWDGQGDVNTAIGELENNYQEDAEDGDYADQFGLINFAQDSDLLSNINVCEVEVNVIAIPILSNNDESYCINTDNDDNDTHGQGAGN